MVLNFLDKFRSNKAKETSDQNRDQISEPITTRKAPAQAAHLSTSGSSEVSPTSTPKPLVSAAQFSALGLKDLITRAVQAEGYESPTPIQEKTIPSILAGRDILGCAQTGTGKTAAFALPMLQRLSDAEVNGHPLRALILAPTRELALQIKESFVVYGRNLPLRTAVVFGGVGLEPQIRSLKAGVDILVATPGRLLDLMGRRAVDFRNIQILVLDEADRMLDMGFIHDINRILKMMPSDRQNLLFSATMPSEVQGLINSILNDPIRVEVTPVSSTTELVDQRLYYVSRADKKNLILDIIDDDKVQKGLVFTRTKHNANKLENWLNDHGIKAAAIHGNKSQNARQRALEDFRNGKVRILVASDLAARGIDIDSITHVINFEMPNEAETYVHRIGRTGRAMATGVAMSFCDHEEMGLLHQIERVTKIKIPLVTEHAYLKDAPTGNEKAVPMSRGRRPSGGGGRGGNSSRGGRGPSRR